MGRKLCDHCGHELPIAAGPRLYCTHCGERINSPKEQADLRQSHVVTNLKKLGYNCSPSTHDSDVFIRLPVAQAEALYAQLVITDGS